jgi:Ca2+-binding RTX toxin-like protein
MATVTYDWQGVSGNLGVNDTLILGNQTGPAVAALNGGTHALALWTDVGGADDLVRGRIIGADNAAPANEFAADGAFGDRLDASVATLANGGAVMTYTMDNGSNPNIIARLFDANGNPVGDDFTIFASIDSDRQSAVTGLADGGFVVTWAHEFFGDDDLHMMVFNADGTVRKDNSWVNANANNTTHSAVAGLAGGGFVVAWEEQVGAETEVRFRRFDANGTALDGTDGEGVLIDTTGSINQDIQVVALQDGGFAVAYTDNGWNGGNDGTDITMRVYNADGTARSGFIRVNTDVAGDQSVPTMTVLSNGFIVVGWKDQGDLVYQAFDSNGTRLGDNEVATNSIVEAEIAALANGRVINVRESTISDGSGNSIRSSVTDFVRTTFGDGSPETLTGDDLRDMMFGLSGNDVLNAGRGDDVLTGGPGADTLNGGAGFDTASYLTSASAVTVSLATGTGLGGDAEGDTLTGIEALTGSVLDDVLIGNGGKNTLLGDFGNDTLIGGGGNDTMNGGAGNDTFKVNNAGDVVVETAGDGNDKIMASVNYALAAGVSVEVLRTSNPAAATAINLTGNELNQTIQGNAGVNVLNGGGGNDVLQGLGGDDTYLVDGTGDKVFESVGGGNDRVLASATYALKAASEVEVLRTDNAPGMAAINLVGNEFAQTLQGNAGNNVLDGRGGDDFMQGLGGNDTYRVDSAGDKTVEAVGGGTDKVLASVSYALQAGREIEVLRTAQSGQATAIDLTGNEFGQTIQGNAGHNVLDGRGGDDVLQGLGGGDTFVFADGYDTDRVAGYQASIDQFDLTGVSGLDSYADLQALMNQVGAHVVINFGGGDVLRILNTTIATLDNNQGDFLV